MAKSENVIYLLHGWAIDSTNEFKWVNFRQELASLSYKTIFFGLPGLTTKLEKPWNLDDYACWLFKKLPKNKKVILLGHSFGGQIAIRFNTRYPNRIKFLILVDSAGIRDSSRWHFLKRKFYEKIAKLLKSLIDISSLKRFLYKVIGASDYFNADPVMKKTLVAVLNDQIIDDLQKINTPTLIIWGKKDKITPVGNAYCFKEKIKNCRLEIISEAKHAPQFTKPKKTASIIANFLNNVSH